MPSTNTVLIRCILIILVAYLSITWCMSLKIHKINSKPARVKYFCWHKTVTKSVYRVRPQWGLIFCWKMMNRLAMIASTLYIGWVWFPWMQIHPLISAKVSYFKMFPLHLKEFIIIIYYYLSCFIAVYIRAGQDVWKPAVSTGIFFSLSSLFSFFFLFFSFFFLFPLPDFFSISPLYHQNLKYASKQSCLCNWPLNRPGRLFSSRPFFTDKCIQTLTSVNMHWFIPGDTRRRRHIF